MFFLASRSFVRAFAAVTLTHVVALSACSDRAVEVPDSSSDSGTMTDGAPHDAAIADAGTDARDGGVSDTTADRGTSSDASPDAVSPTDASVDVPTDTPRDAFVFPDIRILPDAFPFDSLPGPDGGAIDGSSASDAGGDVGSPPDSSVPIGSDGGVPPGDLCNMPFDVSGGGVFTGTTCGAGDELASDCVVGSGAPDIFFSATIPAGFSRYDFNIEPEFVIQQMSPAPGGGCMEDSFSCGVSTYSVFASPTTRSFVIGIERIDGMCGPFTLRVTLRRDS